MWNATSSPGDKAVKVHSSSPVNFKSRSGHKRSNAVDLDLFPEVVEGSEDEESEQDRTHMRRGGVQSSSPPNASSPATSPPIARLRPSETVRLRVETTQLLSRNRAAHHSGAVWALLHHLN